MGWPQKGPTPIYVDNSTVTGIANNTIKRQRSRAMNMRYFWVVDQVTQQFFKVIWAPGLQNLADYFTKHHPAAHHQKVRPYYLSCSNSPNILENAPAPRRLRGCVNTPNGKYTRGMTPLARLSQPWAITTVRGERGNDSIIRTNYRTILLQWYMHHNSVFPYS